MPVTNSGYGIGQSNDFCTEESPLRPISLYGQTKVEAEAAVLDRWQFHQFPPGDGVRHGARMRLDLLVNDFVYRAVYDRSIVLFEAHFRRNFVHVRDVARAFLHGMTNFDTMHDNVFNIGLSDANISKLELCERIQRHLPYSPSRSSTSVRIRTSATTSCPTPRSKRPVSSAITAWTRASWS